MMRKLTAFLATISFSFSSWANISASDLPSLQKQLAQHSNVRGDFTQLRHLALFQKPLASEGRFLLSRQYGLLWQQIEPFSVRLTLTNNMLRQQFSDQDSQIVTSEANPMIFYFSRVFLALFQGDTAMLENEFYSEFSKNNKKWKLKLTPKTSPLKEVFSTITLSGSEYVEQLILTEKRGDETELLFTQQTNLPTSLSEDELNQFAF